MQGAHEASDNPEDEDSIDQNSSISEYGSETDEPPVKFKALNEIYVSTEPIKLEEDELYLMGIDEPVNYSQAAKEGEWRKAMQAEIEVVERNGTCELTELPKGRKAIDLRLLKDLYGLRQAPRAWYSKLNKCLEGLGFTRCVYEQVVYTRHVGSEILIVGVYVDDLLVTGTSIEAIVEFKTQMTKSFDMIDLGKLTYYLGIEVVQRDGYICLKQAGYTKKILHKTGMFECNPTRIPMHPKEINNKDEGGKLVDSTNFKSIIGGLRYLIYTRPDLAYFVGVISRFMEKPTEMLLNAAKRVLRYVKGTMDFGLICTSDEENNVVIGYLDSNLAGDVEDRKSTGATAASCQAIWLRKLLTQVIGQYIQPVMLFIDSKSAIDLAKNPIFHEEQQADSLMKALSVVMAWPGEFVGVVFEKVFV
ncbi:hypothetical protein AgCh_015573 [Apium graveolens]